MTTATITGELKYHGLGGSTPKAPLTLSVPDSAQSGETVDIPVDTADCTEYELEKGNVDKPAGFFFQNNGNQPLRMTFNDSFDLEPGGYILIAMPTEPCNTINCVKAKTTEQQATEAGYFSYAYLGAT